MKKTASYLTIFIWVFFALLTIAPDAFIKIPLNFTFFATLLSAIIILLCLIEPLNEK